MRGSRGPPGTGQGNGGDPSAPPPGYGPGTTGHAVAWAGGRRCRGETGGRVRQAAAFPGAGGGGGGLRDGRVPGRVGLGMLDAFYMTVTTLTTVGYGEVHPLDAAGKLFTISLLALGVVAVAAAISAFTQLVAVCPAWWWSRSRSWPPCWMSTTCASDRRPHPGGGRCCAVPGWSRPPGCCARALRRG